jgi:hypothetical protein
MYIRILTILALSASLAVAGTPSKSVTFHKDVEPIMQARCQGCHRPGETAPMSFLTYQDVRPWAKAIREAVLVKKMPPWYADPHFGKFENDRSLPQKDVETLVAWADGGAKEGDPKLAPKPVTFVDGWGIGKPDVVFEMPHPFPVAASGTVEYQYIVMPTGFKEDKWVQIAEARPGNRAIVHHIIAFIREPGSKFLKDAKPGIPFVPEKKKNSGGGNNNNDEPSLQSELLVGFAPGMAPAFFRPGQARLVKAGSDLVIQMHYTASGTPGEDRSRIGIIFAKEPPKERVITLAAINGKFTIPAGDANYRVDSDFTVNDEIKLVDLMPHMHLRGKDFEFRAVYPGGEKETLLRVPKYDFNWQLFYYLADQKVLPKGTKIECTAHFDNSAANAANPDPKSEVKWGDQSWEEMMIGWFDVAIPVGKNPKDLFPPRKPAPARSSE